MHHTPELLIEMYRRILRIRAFDTKVEEVHSKGEIAGAAHTSLGQEGEIVGACMAVRPDDYMVGNHRSHGHPIGKGANPDTLMAELFGRATGVNRGKGGSMHLADFSIGSLGETSIVATGIPLAAGAALGAKMQSLDRVCLCFFGDGAANTGDFHEGLNLASVWDLPVVYMCENNLYASTTPVTEVTAVSEIAERADAYRIPGRVVDGQDAVAVYEVVSEAVERARAGVGPSLVEAKTYRYRHHVIGMPFLTTQHEDELAEWMRRDPVDIHRARLLDDGVVTASDVQQIETEVDGEIEAALTFARTSALPDLEEAFEHVFHDATLEVE